MAMQGKGTNRLTAKQALTTNAKRAAGGRKGGAKGGIQPKGASSQGGKRK